MDPVAQPPEPSNPSPAALPTQDAAETARLAALHALGLLDTAPRPRWGRASNARDNPQRLAEAQTYILHALETADPPQEASGYNVTAPARECHERSQSWNHQDIEADTPSQRSRPDAPTPPEHTAPMKREPDELRTGCTRAPGNSTPGSSAPESGGPPELEEEEDSPVRTDNPE